MSNSSRPTPRPIVGITTDVSIVDGRERAWCTLAYADAVLEAGGVPLLLVPDAGTAAAQLAVCDAVVFTGGDDPRMEPFGEATHPKASPLSQRRQVFETRLLQLLQEAPRPTLGVCLGMQMMALCAGGRLDQHLPDTRPDAARHWGAEHAIVPEASALALAPGLVLSKHRQAVSDPGRLSILARSDDGVIEAIADTDLPFYLGVQWHPERTADPALGIAIFRQLIGAVRDNAPAGPSRGLCRHPAPPISAAPSPP